MQTPRALDQRVEIAGIAPVRLVVVLRKIPRDQENVRLDRPDAFEHIVVDGAAARRPGDAGVHGDMLDQGRAKDGRQRQDVGLAAERLREAGEKMRGMGIADDKDRRLAGIVRLAAAIVLEEARRPLALLFERIGAVVALVEALHQTFTLRAVHVVIENARNQRRKAAGKALCRHT